MGKLHKSPDVQQLASALGRIRESGPLIQEAYEAREFARRYVSRCKSRTNINKYFDAAKPWELAKKDSPANREELHKSVQPACALSVPYDVAEASSS